jgi:hypothetical protein
MSPRLSTTKDFASIGRLSRIYELTGSIRELARTAAIAIHHKKLETIAHPARKNHALPIRRPRRPAIEICVAGDIVITRAVRLHDKDLRERALDTAMQNRVPVWRKGGVGVAALRRDSF